MQDFAGAGESVGRTDEHVRVVSRGREPARATSVEIDEPGIRIVQALEPTFVDLLIDSKKEYGATILFPACLGARFHRRFLAEVFRARFHALSPFFEKHKRGS